MHMASEILGYRTLHTGYHQEFRFPMCNYLFNNGSLELALAVLENFDAAMDEPVHLMYEEVMTHFPESKFILTISDLEDWHENYVSLVQSMDAQGVYRAEPLKMFEELHPPGFDKVYAQLECSAMASWGCDFLKPTAASKQSCIESHRKHILRVQQVIPPHRLLVYNWSDGWSGLSHFLEKPIPDAEFPHEDLPGDKYIPGHTTD
ncbi:unnamed protein product [Effrenium voratum]|nr:unnamed protein product [Effrenium voratum]